MTIRLGEIASFAGVSESTVSRVLNGKPGVASHTREAVLTAVDVLGYDRPSNLRQQLVGMVGMIVPELTNPIFPIFAQELQSALATAGYTAVVCSQAPGGLHEDDYVAMLQQRSVSGIVFVSGHHANLESSVDRYTELRQRGLPLVLINGYRPEIPAPSVSIDEDAAVELAMSHLISLGHTKIGLATGQSRYVPVVRKVEAFTTLARERLGMQRPQDWVVETWFTLEGGSVAARQLAQRGVTALICGSDVMALGAIRGLASIGVRVPEDVSVVGSDGTSLGTFTNPTLTSIRSPVAAMAAAATQALTDLIAGRQQPAGDLTIAPELIVRGSTGAVAR